MLQRLRKSKTVPVQAMKVYGTVEIKLQAFLILVVDVEGWLPSCPGHITTGKSAIVSRL
jgi:hypothetical protein